jgi:hypothetical protein
MGMLKLGESIKFGAKGNLTDFAGVGWSSHQDSPIATWSAEHVATLDARLPAGAPRVKLLVQASPFLCEGKIAFQQMNIYVNGLWVGFVHAEGFSRTAHVFAGDMLNAGNNMLSFVIPTARVPAALGIGADERCLGFAFESVALERG